MTPIDTQALRAAALAEMRTNGSYVTHASVEARKAYRKASAPGTIIAILDELDALRAAAKPIKASAYPPEFVAAYDAGRKWRAGSTPAAAFKAWKARITAGADPDAIIAGTKAYAAYCLATGSEKKMAQTFFGPGDHYTADWTIPAQAARAGRFDPVAHVNQNSMPPAGDWFDGLVDITPR